MVPKELILLVYHIHGVDLHLHLKRLFHRQFTRLDTIHTQHKFLHTKVSV